MHPEQEFLVARVVACSPVEGSSIYRQRAVHMEMQGIDCARGLVCFFGGTKGEQLPKDKGTFCPAKGIGHVGAVRTNTHCNKGGCQLHYYCAAASQHNYTFPPDLPRNT